MSSSPYAPPLAAVNDAPPSNDVEVIRREHIGHERQLKSLGILFYLGGAIAVIGGITLGYSLIVDPKGFRDVATTLTVFVLVYLALGTTSLVLGFGFRRLKPWVTVPATLVSSIGLLAFPVGTLINARILYLIYCKKGRVVLTHGYSEVIAATPHVKYKYTLGDWIAVGFLVMLVLILLLLLGKLALGG